MQRVVTLKSQADAKKIWIYIRKRLNEKLEKEKMTKSELATILETDKGNITKWLSHNQGGEDPRLLTVLHIMNALEISYCEFGTQHSLECPFMQNQKDLLYKLARLPKQEQDRAITILKSLVE